MATSTVSLKLLIDTKNKRVLFAEAGNEFVDFIFHILSLPLASVISLLGKQGMVGCLSNLYESLENLNDSYIQKGHNKDSLLKSKVPNPITSVPRLHLQDSPIQMTFYKLDLTVKPVSTISSVTLLNKLVVKDLGSLQEKEVNIGMKEALKLLKASLHTNKVLTSVFLNDM